MNSPEPPASLLAERPLTDDEALRLSAAEGRELRALMDAAAAVRDRRWGRTVTFSPKVFLPLTNICRNRCDYCSFRRSPGDPGAFTMDHGQVEQSLSRAREQGCVEALFCLGDKPEGAFGAYRRELQVIGHESTVEYLRWAGERALQLGLLPHTNAGVLSREEMGRLRSVNVSLGLMLENVSPRLCEPGMPHHRAPDKRPEPRLRMLREAGELRIPMTTGILVGIGESRRERVESLIAIREVNRRHGHVQEVIVQNFTPRPGVPMADHPEPDDEQMAHAVAMARLILPAEVSLQSPPNLNPQRTELLLSAGINDFGGISPVTPDFINPRHPWPHLAAFGEACADAGFELRPRLPIYERHARDARFLDPALREPVARCREHLPELGSVSPGDHGARWLHSEAPP
ncbi:MAG: 7,8-didemethyl-8-hydroxy-5-deazariboflavin synthase subunit CofG [Myxococcales bacterium]